MRLAKRLAPLSVLLLIVGCETSAPFKAGVGAGGPRIAMHADAYLVGDSTTDEPTKEMRKAQVAQLRIATANPITFRPVYDAWAGLRSWFVEYSNNDPLLAADVSQKMLRTDVIAAFDKNVEKERKRRAIWFVFDTPPALSE